MLCPLPGFEPSARAEMAARYLWDRVYPSAATFLSAVSAHEPRAVARLVERDGLFAAAAVAGQRVWDDFPTYQRFLPPVRRRALARLWTLRRGGKPS